MKKKIIIIFILMLISIGLKIIYNKTEDSYMLKHLEIDGYQENNGVYTKLISKKDYDGFIEDKGFGFNSKYEELFYEIDSGTFTKRKSEYFDKNLYSIYIASDYQTKITYSYSFESEIMRLYYSGKGKPFTCEAAEDYEKETNDRYCDIIKEEIKLFNKDYYNFIKTSKLNKIKKGTN